MTMINFNEAPVCGTELDHIRNAIADRHICGDGTFTKQCNKFLEGYTKCKKALVTNSCTAALEMSALLLDIQPGDEVICPSYTFITTASSFALRGAKLVFVDIRDDTLNLDERLLEKAITPSTKVIVPVHYAGVCAEMDTINDIAAVYNIHVVEDAAQAIGSTYKGKVAGTMSDLGCYSFHETKNISSGEGGALIVNNPDLVESAEIVREKGTDRSRFLRGQIDKYTWLALGSSYLPSDMVAAYLLPQLEKMAEINSYRKHLWQRYYDAFKCLSEYGVCLPYCPENCEQNAHMFYLRCPDLETRTRFISRMKEKEILCVFHYIPLHSSPAGKKYGRACGELNVTKHVSDTLVRLPLFYGLKDEQQDYIIEQVFKFWRG